MSVPLAFTPGQLAGERPTGTTLSVEKRYRDDDLLDRRETVRQQSSAQSHELVGQGMDKELRWNGRSRSRSSQQLHSGKFHTRDRTHSTARFPTTTKRGRDIGPKHRALFPGLTKRIRVQPFRLAKIAGLRSAKATEPRMRSGKTPDHSAPTTGNTFSVTNGQNLISTKAPASMFRRPCAITWDCNQLTSPTGGSWISKKCHVVRGQRTATTTRS